MSKTTESTVFKRLTAVMKDVDGDAKQIVKGMQAQIDYLLTKCKAWEETAIELNGGKTVTLSDERKKRLAIKGKALNEFLLGEVEKSFAPSRNAWIKSSSGRKLNCVTP